MKRKPGRRILLVAVLFFVGYYVYSSLTVSARSVAAAGDFSLTLSADKAVYVLGERPKLSAVLKNNTFYPVVLLPALDGSEDGRYPRVQWTVTPPENAGPLRLFGRCGNTNPLKVSDFRPVPPRGSIEISEWGMKFAELERGPGEYNLKVSYSTDETTPEQWIGGPLTPTQAVRIRFATQGLLAQVPRFTASSNLVKIRFDVPTLASSLALLKDGTLEEASRALRSIAARPGQPQVPDALLSALARFSQPRNWENSEFVRDALPLFCSVADAEHLDQFWTFFLDEAQRNYHNSVLLDSTTAELVLRMVLKTPQPQREERLNYLFMPQEFRSNSLVYHGAIFPVPTPEVMELLVATPGEDVARLLRWIADNSTSGPALAPAFEEAVAKQQEITSAAAEAARMY